MALLEADAIRAANRQAVTGGPPRCAPAPARRLARSTRGLPKLLPAFLLAAIALASAGERVATEHELKAVCLYHFAQFVEWPPEAFSSPDSPLVIGVLGTDAFGQLLDEVVRGETVRGRKLTVERYRRIEEVKNCHALFISRSEEDRLQRILTALQGKPMLTVADFDWAARRGVMIGLVTEQNRIRLRINVEAARAARLTISSKLLGSRSVEIVGDPTPPKQ